MLRRQAVFLGRYTDGAACLGAGFKGAVIEIGLDEDETAQLLLLRCAAGEQALPRQMMRPAGERRLDRIGQRGQRRVERRELDLAVLDALERQADRREQAAQAGIGGQRAEQGLGGDQLIGDVLDLLDRQEEQAVAREELAAIGAAHRLVELRAITQPLRQIGRRILGLAGCGGIDDDGKEIDVLRKGAIELRLALAPRQVGRDEVIGVGIDAEMRYCIGPQQDAAEEADHHDRQGGTRAGLD